MRIKPQWDLQSVKLYTKVVLVLCAVFFAYGLIDYTIQKRVILPSFESLEADSARTDMERVTRALDRELTQLMTFDDTGRFTSMKAYFAPDDITQSDH